MATLARLPLQPQFVDVVNDARSSLLAALGPQLDSLYLYGSVARASASVRISDLDLTLILTELLSPQDQASLDRLQSDLSARHPEVTKVDFDVGIRGDALHPSQANSWGYWLKHECRCIAGPDLGEKFEAFRPSRAIAQAVNGDYIQVLTDYAQRIAEASNVETTRRLQKEAARKLIRATHVLRPDSDCYWPKTLPDYAAYVSRHHPAVAQQVAYFSEHAVNPNAAANEFNQKLLVLGAWLQQQAKALPE